MSATRARAKRDEGKSLARWLPALALMALIFGFSSLPAQDLPTFGGWDVLVKKGGHLLGYGLLALSYWFALRWQKRHFWTAFVLAVLYAILDEWHQAFVPGRNSSWFDALVIDAGGALLALFVARRKARSG